jgi:hypothetical protein
MFTQPKGQVLTQNEAAEMQESLNRQFSKQSSIEFKVPYKGKKGTFPAEIYCGDGGLSDVLTIINDAGIKQDSYLVDHLGYRGGIAQIIIKTEDALQTFKQYFKQYLEKNDIVGNVSKMLDSHLATSKRKK